MLYGLDLFSGIGGITVALSPWVRPVAYCENDSYAQAVLLSRQAAGALPLAPIWDDVRTLRGDLLPAVDIIYGGFPCQDISVAGRGGGVDGERSGLVFQVLRLIGEVRPAFVFLENVPAIRTRGGERVVKELAALGYDARWDCISAEEVGAPHKRARWFLLAAHTDSLKLRLEQGRSGGENWQGTPEPGVDGTPQPVANSKGIGRRQGNPQPGRGSEGTGETPERSRPSDSRGWWEAEPNVGRVADGIPARVDRLRALGNAVVPFQAREAFCRLMGLSLVRFDGTTSDTQQTPGDLDDSEPSVHSVSAVPVRGK